MNMFKTHSDVAAPVDTLGGGSRILESGVYDMAVDMAYLEQSKGGAYALNLVLKTMDGKSLRQQLWVTSGLEKGQLTYYVDKKGDKQYLPGFNVANALAVLTTGKPLGELEPEEKMVSVYNFDLKKEVPTAKQVLVELLGQMVKVGVIKQTVFKNVKNATGAYVASTETRDENEIAHVFHNDNGQTFNEFSAGTEPEFMTKWAEANTGKTRDRTKKAAAAGAAAPAAKASLFNK